MKERAPVRVLCVDDTPEMHELYRKVLIEDEALARTQGRRSAEELPVFELDSASQGTEALKLVTAAHEAGRPYAVAFVDMRMPPGWDGIETIERLWEVEPALEVVICTGFIDFSTEDLMRRLRRTDQLLLVKKPFDDIEIRLLAFAKAEKWRLGREEESFIENLDNLVQARSRELEEKEAQLRQSQKMESIGQLAGGIAHDFNNLLTVINGHVGLILSAGKLDAQAADSMREISEAGKRATALTGQLMTFSRKHELELQAMDLNAVVNNITKMLKRILGEDVALDAAFGPELPPIKADLGMIEQVLLNLAVNSRDAMPRGGKLRITTSVATLGAEAAKENPESRAGTFVRLDFRDTGCGIAPEHLGRIFEPFFTTKELHRGTGLGLATVYGIVKQHRGWIEVSSAMGKGTEFRLYFPASTEAPGVIASSSGEAKVLGGTETILVVEDEGPLLKLIHHILESFGYKVLGCGTGQEALALWAQHRSKVDLLLTDLILPDGMAGPELAKILQLAKPGLKVLYTSGYNAERLAMEFPPGEQVSFVQKPFHARKLAEAVYACLNTK